MSNLSNLYISQSYFGIINLEDSQQPLVSQSGDINLQDGAGDNLGLKINAQTNKFTIVNDLQVDGNADFNGNIDVSGSWTHTGSIDVIGDVTVVGDITAHTGSFDTIHTRILHVTLESSSVIFSSGSNILGDEITDTQTLVGQVSISGSLSVDGNSVITGSLSVTNEISSSTINGIGNVTDYSASVDSRLDELEGPFSTSVDFRLDSLENYTASQDVINSGYNTFTQSIDTRFNSFTQSIDTRFNTFTSSYYVDSASFDTRIDALEDFSSSLVATFVTDLEYSASIAVVTGSLLNVIDTKLDSASFDTWTGSVFLPFSSSVDTRINTNTSNLTSVSASFVTTISNLSSSIATTDLNQQNEINSLIAETSSYARLDTDNIFENNNFFSGSVRGSVYVIPISLNTASIDCSQGNFFTLNLGGSTNTLLNATNITGGRTITVRINKTNPSATLTIDTGSIKMPFGFSYTITPGDEKEDIITFVSFDTGSLYGVSSKNFV